MPKARAGFTHSINNGCAKQNYTALFRTSKKLTKNEEPTFFNSLSYFRIIFSSCQKEELILPNTNSQYSNFASAEIDGLSKTNNNRGVSNARVLVSSNTTAIITEYNYESGASMAMSSSYSVPYLDADGIVYDSNSGALYQVNRTDNNVAAIANFDSFNDGEVLNVTEYSSSDFLNGREAAFSSGQLVVAQNAAPDNGDQNAFAVYRVSPGAIQYAGTLNTDINLWGIVDNSNMLAYFEKFARAMPGTVNPTATVMIEGIVRTHGLNYSEESDVMVLTDVGEASSATDGAIVVISDFSTKWQEAVMGSGVISLDDQIRISGPMSMLGNPVDVAYNALAETIYIAERANAGGQFLTFNLPNESGDASPVEAFITPGASAVTIAND